MRLEVGTCASEACSRRQPPTLTTCTSGTTSGTCGHRGRSPHYVKDEHVSPAFIETGATTTVDVRQISKPCRIPFRSCFEFTRNRPDKVQPRLHIEKNRSHAWHTTKARLPKFAVGPRQTSDHHTHLLTALYLSIYISASSTGVLFWAAMRTTFPLPVHL